MACQVWSWSDSITTAYLPHKTRSLQELQAWIFILIIIIMFQKQLHVWLQQLCLTFLHSKYARCYRNINKTEKSTEATIQANAEIIAFLQKYRMAAGSRLSWCIMDFFSRLQLFNHTVLNSTSLAGCRTWCPTDLQHLCCKVLINK